MAAKRQVCETMNKKSAGVVHTQLKDKNWGQFHLADIRDFISHGILHFWGTPEVGVSTVALWRQTWMQ